MEYGYLEERTHSQRVQYFDSSQGQELDHGHVHTFGSYAHSIFRRLLVHDSLPDTNRQSAIDELLHTLRTTDPAFSVGYTKEFQLFVNTGRYLKDWQKIRQDSQHDISFEERRRNAENPYHTEHPERPEAWEEIPVPERAYKNKPWQYDMLYRDISFLALKIKELCASYQQELRDDADLFRMKANMLLAADKVIFALDSGENRGSFLEASVNIVDTKLTLDGLRLAHVFLGRSLESLRKVELLKERRQSDVPSDQPQALLEFGEQLRQTIHQRASAVERRLLLFMRLGDQF